MMMRTKYMLMAGFIIATPALAAYAPPEPVKLENTIVVTGQRLDKKIVKQEASNFIRAVIPLSVDGQYARRKAPICPKVMGIDEQYAQIVEKRIKRIADSADIDIAPQKCKLNLVVKFTTNSEQVINDLKKTNTSLFSSISSLERKTFFENTAPIRWWYNLNRTGSDGRDLIPSSSQQEKDIPIGRLDSSKGFTRSFNSSLIDTNFILNIEANTVVVDIDKVTGFPLDTIAAYIAMISLAHIRQDADYGGAPSILGIFNKARLMSDAPRDLTEWDYAYLRALYKTPLNRTARAQRSRIVGAMAKELTGEQNAVLHPK
jgi:hypothetical protein